MGSPWGRGEGGPCPAGKRLSLATQHVSGRSSTREGLCPRAPQGSDPEPKARPGMWLDVEMPKAIVKAFYEQREKFGYKTEGYSTGYRNTDHHTVCKELGLRWSVDSSD